MAYNLAMENPGKWIRSSDCKTSEETDALSEAGGMLQWCATCDLFNSPNRPCFCGGIVLQRKRDGLFWAGSIGWVVDWKFDAEHYFSLDTAKKIAAALYQDAEGISIYVIHTGWLNDPPKESVG